MKLLWRMTVGVAFGASLASATGISYTCDPNVSAITCNYLNTTIANLYNAFTDANASIYIRYGTTALVSTKSLDNIVRYSDYVTALAANSNKDAIQSAALTALSTYDATPYGGGDVILTTALVSALNLSADVIGGLKGITSTGASCSFPNPGCFVAVVTVTNDPGTPLYYDNLGGMEPADASDYYATVEHATDEVLGTASCIATGSGVFSDPCDSEAGVPANTGTPSAVDLFRYRSAGTLALDSTDLGLTAGPAAYFSYNGGSTNGAVGDGGSPKFYNSQANGDDYADFLSSSPDCGTNLAVQDAVGCPGEDAGRSIANDGRGEINILNAVGYDLLPTPEPGTMGLLAASLAVLAAYRRRP